MAPLRFMVTATETTAQPENAFYLDIQDIEQLHHTRCDSFYLDQKDRFEIIRNPLSKDYLPYHHDNGCIMMFTNTYLEARAIHHWFESNLSGIAASMIMYDTASLYDQVETYVILTTISMEYYESLLEEVNRC